MTRFRHLPERRDRGSILPIVLVVTVVLGIVVVAIATYTTSTLRYGQISEGRSDELAAAQAAMSDALEQLQLPRSLCSTDLSSSETPVNPNFPPINGVSADVTCTVNASGLPPLDGWAVVVTGNGTPSGSPSLETTNGGQPVIEGPVYMSSINTSAEPGLDDPSFKSTKIQEGDLWHEDDGCAGATGTPGEIVFAPSYLGGDIDDLTFAPSTRGTICTNQAWSELFIAYPPTAPAAAATTAPAPTVHEDIDTDGDGNGDGQDCVVFQPGLYSNPSQLQSLLDDYNYFVSGVYVFQNLGTITIKQKELTFGQVPESVAEGYPIVQAANSPCNYFRSDDPDEGGATLYLAGNTTFNLEAAGKLEVSGRQQGDFRVALHALDASTSLPASSVANIISVDNGNGKEVGMSGLTWAPDSRIDIGTVASSKDASFRGGLVIGSFRGKVSGSGDGFVIKVPTSQQSSSLILESTAGTTTVRVVADWRPTSGDLAVNSWRVCDNLNC